MKFTRQAESNYLFADTEVENLFISEYLAKADGDYIKVYLYALMCSGSGLECNNQILARQLGLEEKTIEEAWSYWEEKGTVKKLFTSPGKADVYDIEFVSLRTAIMAGSSSAGEEKRVSLGSKQLSALYKNIEAICSRMLSGTELEEISSLISDYGMDPELVSFGFKYCTESRKSNKARYVAAVLKDWKAKDLMSVQDVTEFLSGVDMHYEQYRRIFRELGFSRNPSEPEKRMMNTWLDDMALPMDRIIEACEKTTRIASPNLSYVNTVLVGESKLTAEKPRGEDLFARVEAMYVRAREKNQALYEERIREIYTQLPRVREIAGELKDARYKVSKSFLAGFDGKKIADEQRKRIDGLVKEKRALLKDAGYGENATDMIYDCPDCKDTGLDENGERCHCYSEKLAMLQNRKQEI